MVSFLVLFVERLMMDVILEGVVLVVFCMDLSRIFTSFKSFSKDNVLVKVKVVYLLRDKFVVMLMELIIVLFLFDIFIFLSVVKEDM